MEPRIESIHVGRPRCFDAEGESGKPWQSAICKTQVAGPVMLSQTNLDGDEQADLVHHGGRDKAVLAHWPYHAAVQLGVKSASELLPIQYARAVKAR